MKIRRLRPTFLGARVPLHESLVVFVLCSLPDSLARTSVHSILDVFCRIPQFRCYITCGFVMDSSGRSCQSSRTKARWHCIQSWSRTGQFNPHVLLPRVAPTGAFELMYATEFECLVEIQMLGSSYVIVNEFD